MSPLERASRYMSSRKSGWARLIIALAGSGMDVPLRWTSPNSVTRR